MKETVPELRGRWGAPRMAAADAPMDSRRQRSINSSSANPAVVGQTVTFTAHLSGGASAPHSGIFGLYFDNNLTSLTRRSIGAPAPPPSS